MTSNTGSRETSQVPSQEVEDRNILEHTTPVRQVVVSTSSDSAEGLGVVEEVGGSAWVLSTSLDVRYGVQETTTDTCPVRLSSVT